MRTLGQRSINRELSWLAFNRRVLLEAMDHEKAAVERLRFSAIFSANLDEFFMVRVGSLKDQVNAGFFAPDPSGMMPAEQLEAILEKSRDLVREQEAVSRAIVEEELPALSFRLTAVHDLQEGEADYLRQYFMQTVYPVLTPMGVDYARPFPLVLNKSLNIAVLIRGDGDTAEYDFATVQVPSVLPRFVPLKYGAGGRYVLIEEIIRLFLAELFQGREVIAALVYRITRNADLDLNDEEASDLLLEIEASLKRRKWGEVVRLELEENGHPELRRFLMEAFEVTEAHVFESGLFPDLTAFFSLSRHIRQERDPFKPQLKKLVHSDFFEEIRSGDLFFHHPYDDFSTLENFIREASQDRHVLAIKQVLYRVGGDSPIVAALAHAAEQGKQVTVLVELQARFDEENNIQWAKQLERTGCHVIYGYPGLKTHAKVSMVVRKEGAGIRRYVHLSTGNYNGQTARIYTDMGILTANETIAHDVSRFFNVLSGFSRDVRLEKLVMAPTDLRNTLVQLIDREIQNARKGRSARIIAKMNALVDQPMIEKLYEASQAGVEIDLIIRGICCLVPGAEGFSERIRVRSIVGKYLEHSRIFCFANHGNEEIYLSSADWMPRNLSRRVELMFPVEDPDIRGRIRRILDLYLKGTRKVSVMGPDGVYQPVDRAGFDPQQVLETLASREEADFAAACDKILRKHG